MRHRLRRPCRLAAAAALVAVTIGAAGVAHAHAALLWIFDKDPPEQGLISFPGFDATPLLDDAGAFNAAPGHFSDAAAGLWNVEGGEAGARYYAFTVTPQDIRSTDLEQVGWVAIAAGAPGQEPTHWKLELNGVELERGTLISAGWMVEVIDLGGPSFQNLLEPLEFRIYAWGASSPDAYAAFDSLFVNLETAESIPALPPAAWLLLALALLGVAATRSGAPRRA